MNIDDTFFDQFWLKTISNQKKTKNQLPESWKIFFSWIFVKLVLPKLTSNNLTTLRIIIFTTVDLLGLFKIVSEAVFPEGECLRLELKNVLRVRREMLWQPLERLNNFEDITKCQNISHLNLLVIFGLGLRVWKFGFLIQGEEV